MHEKLNFWGNYDQLMSKNAELVTYLTKIQKPV